MGKSILSLCEIGISIIIAIIALLIFNNNLDTINNLENNKDTIINSSHIIIVTNHND